MRRLAPLALFFLLGLGCAGSTPPPEGSGATKTSSTTAAAPVAAPVDPVAHVDVFAFSDFHGWLLPLEPKGFNKSYGGIAHIAAMLNGKEKLDPRRAIVVDNGDMWTGPTESTLLRGEPVIQAYNNLGLSAANIANHEFDFGVEVLKARIGEAHFPFLGANIVQAGSGQTAPFVKPFTIVERSGIKVGIIGLSYIDTPRTTLAKHVAGLEFRPYKETLERVVPEARKAGAEVIVVLFHDTVEEITKVLTEVQALDITAVVAGQNHRKEDAKIGTTLVVNPGPFGRSYAHFSIDVDRATKKVAKSGFEVVDVEGEVGAPAFPPSPEMLALVEAARQKAATMSGEVLGKLAKPLPVGTFADSPLGHMIADAWLAALPHADFAICNHGAIRQPLAAGPVTIGDVLAVLPFENNLYVVKLTGKQLKDQLAIDGPVVAGLSWRYKEDKKGRTVVSASDRMGKPIDDKKVYKIVINDFMYFGGDGFHFKDFDAAPEDSGLSLREPVMRTLRAAETTGRAVEPSPGARAAKAK
ncbi:MAG: bifunctional UDP-sugar hydrolase/5'-nucleotidase [Myxococcota bacterium]